MKLDVYQEWRGDQTNGPILAVCCSSSILYIGKGPQLISYLTGETLYTFERSVRAIIADETRLAAASYDGTVALLDQKTGRVIERVEGPDTEAKGIAMAGGFLAIATRGKTVWILEDFEITKILEDHTQDVKGCRLEGGRLYSWSYDNTVKVYELFMAEHSWELVQSIDLGCIVWNVLFLCEKMYVFLHSGQAVCFEMADGIWIRKNTADLSVCPVMASCVADGAIAVICNRNCLALFDKELKLVAEKQIGSETEILSCCYWTEKKSIACGSEDGVLYLVKMD